MRILTKREQRERIPSRARELARSGKFSGWYAIEVHLRNEEFMREARQVLDNERLRDELDKLCAESRYVQINSADFWVKVVAMLQQNWAVIEPLDTEDVQVYFVDDAGGVFDELTFPSVELARRALQQNKFRRLADDERAQSFLVPPKPPFYRQPHPNGPIYSSGRYWHD